MPKVFIAGPLFSQAEREFNLKLDGFLRGHGFETFLPQRNAGILHELIQKQGKRAYRTIYERDLKGLERSDVVVAVLDGPDVDSGTAYEIGYARAKGKPVVGLKTDLRFFAKGEEVNVMIAQGLHALARNFDELLTELKRLKLR